jgi:hypothetical protein
MAEIIIAKFELDKLSKPACFILKAAVLYAARYNKAQIHEVPLGMFCALAGVPNMSAEKIRVFLNEALRAVAILEVVDTESPDRDDLPYSSWPVFRNVGVSKSTVLFEIRHQTFDERLLVKLLTH